MTLHRLSTSIGLLASKGAATPLALRKVPVGEVEEEPATDTQESRAAAEPPTQLTLVSNLEGGESTATVSEPPPPASLLPFALHRKRPEQSESWELVSPDLLARLSQAPGKDRAEEATAGQEPEAEPQGASAESQKPDELEEVSPPRLASPGSESVSKPSEALGGAGATAESSSEPSLKGAQTAQATPAATGDMPEARPAAPVADPAWRVGADSRSIAGDSGSANWLGWGAAAILLVSGIAWWSLNTQMQEPAVEPDVVQSETSREPVSSSESKVDSTVPTPAPAARESSTPAEPDQASKPQVSEEAQSLPSVTDPVAPSVDLVRIEPNGDAVIAGRAAPNSELILLDNGTPIGSIKADAFGEWVFVPDQPLPQGAHEFGLVLKSVQGKVRIPAEAKKTPEAEDSGGAPAGAQPSEAAPAPDDGAKLPKENNSLLAPLPPRKPEATQRESAVVAPIPGRKPDLASELSSQSSSISPPSAGFVVQLASVKTRDGARREWRKLQSRFPKALSGMDLNLHETKLSRRGTVIRVRTGPFPGFSEAVDFCAQIRTSRQDCLVVRTSGGN